MSSALVIKVGGALLQSSDALQALFSVVSQIHSEAPVVLVHGGGDTAQSLLEALGFESHKVDGVRVTPVQHLPYITGALAGTVNTQLCAAATKGGCKPVGLTLLDGGMCHAASAGEKFGAVGEVSPSDPSLLMQLLASGFLPVVSSIGGNPDGELYNINADDAAAAIAQLLGADLVLLTDVPGVLDDTKQLIAALDTHKIIALCDSGVIAGGMVVKVKSALKTAKKTQKSVYIASWKQPEHLLSFRLGGHCGTRIYDATPLDDEHSMTTEAV